MLLVQVCLTTGEHSVAEQKEAESGQTAGFNLNIQINANGILPSK